MKRVLLISAVLALLTGSAQAQTANTDLTSVPTLNPGYTAVTVNSLLGNPLYCNSTVGAGANLVAARTSTEYYNLFNAPRNCNEAGWKAQLSWRGAGWYCATLQPYGSCQGGGGGTGGGGGGGSGN